MHAPAELRAGPCGGPAREFLAEQRPWPFVLDDQDAQRSVDRDAEPVVAGGEVEGEVDAKGCLADAAVSVEHRGAPWGDERRVRFAEDGAGAGLVDADELFDGDDPERV